MANTATRLARIARDDAAVSRRSQLRHRYRLVSGDAGTVARPPGRRHRFVVPPQFETTQDDCLAVHQVLGLKLRMNHGQAATAPAHLAEHQAARRGRQCADVAATADRSDSRRLPGAALIASVHDRNRCSLSWAVSRRLILSRDVACDSSTKSATPPIGVFYKRTAVARAYRTKASTSRFATTWRIRLLSETACAYCSSVMLP